MVGVVTDLDGHLAERVLRSLEAEVRRREEVLRDAGCDDIVVARAAGSPLSRLVVVIDEFATLAAELPELLRSIVNVARRGRSLGVHLVLATQRPGAAVSDEIRANTNLRIALRVQDIAASNDVVGVPTAAHISRAHPGRAVVRFGDRDHVTIQTARVTGPSGGAAAVVVRPRLEPPQVSTGPSELDQLVGVIRRAATLAGERTPHRPWLDALPAQLDLAEVPLGSVAIADRPDEQRQTPLGWDRSGGHLLLYGGPGAGTTTALGALALDLARSAPPDDMHLLVVDLGGGHLAPLAGLPACRCRRRAWRAGTPRPGRADPPGRAGAPPIRPRRRR